MKYFINFILIPLSGVFSGLSKRSQFFCAQILGIIWFDVIRLRRKLVIQNISVAFPDWAMEKKISVGRQSVQHLCLSFFEYMIIYNYKPEMHSKYFDIHNEHIIRNQLQKGKGALLMTLHMGAIDFALVGFTGFGYKVNATLKRIKDVHIDKFVNDLRDKNGIKFIADRKNPFDIFRALKNNEAVVFVMDQHMGRPHGIQVDFFGKKAWTAAGLAAFAMKTQMPVIPLYNFRRDDGKIAIDVLDPIELEVNVDREQNIKVMTQKYNDALEKIIRLHPEQWLWVHRRWKD
ncbi:MAG: lysophospholipid acyltransferase family protein [Bdellovibrionota bacterium]